MSDAPTRINVVGTSGSGKTTLARVLSEKLNVPYVEIDALFWKPDWTGSRDEEFLPKLREALSGDSWVLDGNYDRTAAIKWDRVQMVVWLDLPLWLVLYRVTLRTIVRALTRQTLWSGNRESLRVSFFSRDSIIWWSLTTHRQNRARYMNCGEDPKYAAITFVPLRSRKAVEKLLEKI